MSQLNGIMGEPGATLPRNDAERWIAATYAIWSEYCGGSFKYLGGYEKTEASAKLIAKVLKEDWLVTDHDSGVDMVEYLLENAGPDDDDYIIDEEFDIDEDFDDDEEYDDEGSEDDDEEYEDDEEYDEDDEEYDEDDEEYEDDDEDDEEYEDDDEYDDDGIDYSEVDTTAFDYACACNMCGRMYIAGYFTRDESIAYATKAAKKIQELYSSWVEYFQTYIIGAAGGSNIHSVQPFIDAYQKVLMDPQSPLYLDWNTQL